MFVRLSDPSGSFYDSKTGFRIRRDQVIEMPRIGTLSRAWLSGGGLVMCDKPADNLGETISTEPNLSDVEVDTETASSEPEAKRGAGRPPKDAAKEADVYDEAKALMENNSAATLREMAKQRGMKPAKSVSASTIAKNIVAYDKKQSNG